MYNMYSWDQAARAADEHTGTQPTETHPAARNGGPASHNGGRAIRNGHARPASRNGQAHPAAGTGQAPAVQAVPRHAPAATRHAQAVQFSLDRRDNGGDAGRTR